MGLREVLGLGHTEDGRLPKSLGLVVAIESLAGIFCLADVYDRLRAIFVFAEQEVDPGQIELFALFALSQITARNQNRLNNAGRNFRNTDSTWLAGGQIDLDRFTTVSIIVLLLPKEL
ncbi:hypothetical protein [Roseiconus lacunae]|uniref:hypothetical protein n=1 Tax=Roseiconus lacunae TaxID=2605694 RepID=UPI001E42A22F|nr:hypothetical protein [Roseiconus lacunae]MCD0462038.1 hypothetical protein [Roseiconus lacunae]